MSSDHNQAILLVTFGTNVTTAASAFNNLEQRVKTAYPGIELRWAYTAKTIRNTLTKQGICIDSPITALAKLQDEGYTRVAVQSVHILPGQEFYDLVNVVDNMLHFQGSSGKHFQSRIGKFGFEKLSLGTPLLYNFDDYTNVVEAIDSYIPTDPHHALVLAGHGSGHHSFSAYGCLNDMLRQSKKNVFLGTVEGYPSLTEVKKDLSISNFNKITIFPFMNIAGEHAVKDIAGNHSDSWLSQLSEQYEVQVELTGLLDNPSIVDIYLKHLAEALKKL